MLLEEVEAKGGKTQNNDLKKLGCEEAKELGRNGRNPYLHTC